MSAKVLPWLGILAMFLFPKTSEAQKQTPLDVALRYVEKSYTQWDLATDDFREMKVSHQYQSQHNQVHHFYFLQQYAGIEVESAILGVHVKSDGTVGYATNRFVAGITEKVNAVAPTLSAIAAIEQAAGRLGLPFDQSVRFQEKENANTYRFSAGKLAKAPIQATLIYWPHPISGAVKLAWRVQIEEPVQQMKIWDILVDASEGQILEQRDRVLRCSFSDKHQHETSCTDSPVFEPLQKALTTEENFPPMAGETYNVFALPLANPLQGARQLTISPSDPTASPFGWHDTDGAAGAEYTITRGNNVHAYQSRDGNVTSAGDEPEGGANLIFDFPLDLSKEPDQYVDAAVTQLFYTSNYIHDFAYAYGFDEAAGNFQENNYDKGGTGSDAVRARAQFYGADPYQEPADPSDDQLNNAVFFSSPEGESPRMHMFLFDRQGNDLFTVVEPEAIRGAFETGIATFGPNITGTAIEGQIVNAVDNSNNPSLVCGAVANASEVNGKIAMLDRGDCFFKEKTINAQAAGAIAVIICNFEDVIIDMGGPASVDEPTIPTLMLKNTDCQTVRSFLDQGVEVRLQQPDVSGPTFVDGDFDNEVVIHEYGHGISNRLTGGAFSSCLGNDEQMGEGWSDFFSLVTTVKAGETGEEPKHVGSYIWTRTADGTGVRRLPYSSTMTVNNQTFNDIIGTGGRVFNPEPGEPNERGAPHPLGEIWTGALWDLYWAMVDKYDFDEDQLHGDGGNNMAIQLVVDGMKLQACNPGFIDGRDAILKADELSFNGANQCLIWEVFARRGLGYGADQGNINDRNDGIESFAVHPECISSLKINKEATALIIPGEEITYTLEVHNHKPTALTGVVVTDILPEGTSLIAGSASGSDNVDLNGDLLSFEVGDMAAGDTLIFSYRVMTALDLKSTRQFYDDVESNSTEETWIFDFIEGTTIWEVSDFDANSGEQSWYVENTNADNDQILFLAEPFRIEGEQPALRFYHKYETETGFDGGFVEVSIDGGNFWQIISKDKYFRGNNLRPLNYSTFAVPGIEAFSGNTNDQFIASYIDLSDFIGQDVQFRFRFGTDDVESRLGWFVDDIEILDIFNYQSEACVTSSEGDQACAAAPERGTVVEDQTVLPVSELPELGAVVSIFPNPARTNLNVAVTTEQSSPVTISVFSVDGKLLLRKEERLSIGSQLFNLDVSDLASGFYMVRLDAGNSTITEKIIVE